MGEIVHNPVVYGLLLGAGVPTQYVFHVAENAYMLAQAGASIPALARLVKFGTSVYNRGNPYKPPGWGGSPNVSVLDMRSGRPVLHRPADVATIRLP